jgi:hypothetical protein
MTKMAPRFSGIVLLFFCGLSTPAQTPRRWTLAANGRFEVYSQRGEESARTTLAWLERLRALLIRETGLQPDRLRPARLIGFASAAEYQAHRLEPGAEAHYVGTEGRDYIVMSLDGLRAPGIAAHEYAHMTLHAAGIELPRWLAEGLAEVSATLRLEDGSVVLGADRPEHSRLLRRVPWIPFAELLRLRGKGAGPSAFYAQSWALADMLVFSPEYGSKLRALIGALAAMTPEEAFASVHGRTLDGVAADLHTWIGRRKAIRPLRLPGVAAGPEAVAVAEVPRLRVDLLLAGLLLDAGELSRAETAYSGLLRDAPENGDVHAGLGTIALQRGRRDEARERWSHALALGVSDDALCYRYTALAQNAGLSEADVRPVLQRAVEIRPAFDDARYALALIEKNAGRPQSALDHLRAMREPGQSRAFGYWSAVSDALNSLERQDEAEAAARNAAAHATTPAERTHAEELAFIARTEIAVQAVPDAQGRPRMVTTRIPRRTANWNPFVEPLDDVRTVEGELREVDCAGPVTRIVVEAGAARQTLAIPDPARVQMRNAPSEFTCGPQSGGRVIVVYAAPRTAGADAIVRGIEFRP